MTFWAFSGPLRKSLKEKKSDEPQGEFLCYELESISLNWFVSNHVIDRLEYMGCWRDGERVEEPPPEFPGQTDDEDDTREYWVASAEINGKTGSAIFWEENWKKSWTNEV